MTRAQAGNNNAYCQDNVLTWFDWQHADNELLDFTAGLIDLRRRFPQLRRIDWLTGNFNAQGQRDITWWHPDGREMSVNDWNLGQPGALGFTLSAPENMANSQTLLVLINRDPHGLQLHASSRSLANNSATRVPTNLCLAATTRYTTIARAQRTNSFTGLASCLFSVTVAFCYTHFASRPLWFRRPGSIGLSFCRLASRWRAKPVANSSAGRSRAGNSPYMSPLGLCRE